MTLLRVLCVASALLVLGGEETASAQSAELPPELEGIGIEQRLGARIPTDVELTDHEGRRVRLGDLMTGRPLVLTLVYYECPMLCTMVLNGTLRALNTLELDAGADFDVLTISIDPTETPELAAKKRKLYLEKYGRESAAQGWHFLVGEEENVRAIADTVGFAYAWNEKTQQYAHASGIMVLTPEGTVSKYLFGVDYSPTALRLALVEASQGEIGSLADALFLYCFSYDPATGQYSLVIMNVLKLAAAGTVLALGLLIGVFLWRERRDANREWVTP